MNMKKIALAAAVAALSTASYAAYNTDVDTGLTSTLAALTNGTYEGSYLNLSINNTDTVDASINLGAVNDVLSDAALKTTGIGAVSSGNIALVASGATGNLTTDTGTTNNNTSTTITDKSTDTTKTLTDVTEKTSHTSTTAVSESVDKSSISLDVATDKSSVTLTDLDKVAGTSTNITGEVTSNFAALNLAYNNATIDASVDLASSAGGVQVGGGLVNVSSITTTAIGAAQSGNITVTLH